MCLREASNSSVSTYAVNANGTLTSLGPVSRRSDALCWISGANGYFFGSNSGSGNVSSFDETAGGAPQLVNVTQQSHTRATSTRRFSRRSHALRRERGQGTVDAYSIGASGTLNQMKHLNIPSPQKASPQLTYPFTAMSRRAAGTLAVRHCVTSID